MFSENSWILAFDTSAAHCAAALLSGDRMMAGRQEEMARGQAEHLFPLLEALLAEGGLGWSDLSAVAVGVGPGNFTGLRIAVAAARGLALSLEIPAVGVTTFEALAEGTAGAVLAIVDARQDRLYAQWRTPAGNGEPVTCTLDTLPAAPGPGAATVVGHRAAEVALRLGVQALPAHLPLAEAIGRRATARLAAGATDGPPLPLYLREADAAPAGPPPARPG